MGLFLYPKEVCPMGYRKVGYLEQIWYILRYKFREIKRMPFPLMANTLFAVTI